jgi:phage host-nuclease inhibitor protein Gam
MSDPFGALSSAMENMTSALEAGAETAASAGRHYEVDPGAIKDAIRHYRRLYTEMEEDRLYIGFIKQAQAPVEDGPSHGQAAALRQFGNEIEAAHEKQIQYLHEEIQKLQKSLEDYERQEEETAEGFRGQA